MVNDTFGVIFASLDGEEVHGHFYIMCFDEKVHLAKSAGPALWTDTVFRFFNDPEYFDMSSSKGNITWKQFTGIKAAKKVGDVIVLPITSFSPGVKQMGAGEDDDPMAFVKHKFEGT